jgi:UDP-N-acetyl-D-glucosamine dehydrogenase
LKYSSKKKKICIIGLGYVGLPLAILSTNKGFDTTGVDIDLQRLESIKKKKVIIDDVFASNIYNKTNLKLSDKIVPADIFIICVPTPVDIRNQPEISSIINAVKMVKKVLRDNNLIIIESTVYPGMCREIVYPILKKNSKKFYLAHCPERINPGDRKWNVENIPRVIAGIDNKSLQVSYDYYSKILSAKIEKLRTIESAEATKILENIFRDVNIALVNEMAQAFFRMKIDTTEVIKGASTKPFGFMPHWPGVGVGGHCIAVDPYYMIEKGRASGFDHEFLKLARKINSNMPIYTVHLLQNSLNIIGKSLKNSKIGLYGLSYKPNISDSRESPTLQIFNKLKEEKKAKVKIFDPNLLKDSSFSSFERFIKWTDALIICTAHREILSVDFKKFKNLKVIIDGRNCLNKEKIKSLGIIYKGIGNE